MKYHDFFKFSAVSGLALMLGVSLIANGQSDDMGEETFDEDTFFSDSPENTIHADKLIGQEVESKVEDESIGSINDLILSDDGEIVGALVGVGGFLGVGEKDVAIAWDALEIRPDDSGRDIHVEAEADEESLRQAVEYEAQ
ncbi:hypothetical protein J2T60_001194 [Natronospira proteinivora]|uniref:PRC-barrel domain-containing protein n=1 Tax=Natronospira proteinivora TaxID=1807133 RepID=A0ABT1G7E6_9GAMM|nr:PRC-barrel domain-containing protein [Natronospira proteinivora]MCP1727229.1 hypothetical protein [Natronospira proteinivora]